MPVPDGAADTRGPSIAGSPALASKVSGRRRDRQAPGCADGQRAAPRLPTHTGAGLQPGVDLTDGAALLAVMDADAGR